MSGYNIMNPLIADRNRDISKIVKEIKLRSKKTIFVFDVHKTALTFDGKPDLEVKKYINHLISLNYNIVFLSYDGKDQRIIENNKNINQIREYKLIPRIFIKKRNKHLVMKELCKNNTFDNRMKYNAVLIDDNVNNINDVMNLNSNEIFAYYYTKNNRYNGNNTLSNLGKLFSVLKLSKTGHFKSKTG